MAVLLVVLLVVTLLFVGRIGTALSGEGRSTEGHKGQNEGNEHCPNKFIHGAKATVFTF